MLCGEQPRSTNFQSDAKMMSEVKSLPREPANDNHVEFLIIFYADPLDRRRPNFHVDAKSISQMKSATLKTYYSIPISYFTIVVFFNPRHPVSTFSISGQINIKN